VNPPRNTSSIVRITNGISSSRGMPMIETARIQTTRNVRRYSRSRTVDTSYLAIDIVVAPEMGTIKCAYGVPFHITQGPPFFGSVEKPSSTFTSW